MKSIKPEEMKPDTVYFIGFGKIFEADDVLKGVCELLGQDYSQFKENKDQ